MKPALSSMPGSTLNAIIAMWSQWLKLAFMFKTSNYAWWLLHQGLNNWAKGYYSAGAEAECFGCQNANVAMRPPTNSDFALPSLFPCIKKSPGETQQQKNENVAQNNFQSPSFAWVKIFTIRFQREKKNTGIYFTTVHWELNGKRMRGSASLHNKGAYAHCTMNFEWDNSGAVDNGILFGA